MRIYSISKNIFGRPQGLAKCITTWSPPWLTAIHPSPTLIKADQGTATPRRIVLAMKGNRFHQNLTDACLPVHAKRCSALIVMRWYSSSQDKGQKNMLERPGKKNSNDNHPDDRLLNLEQPINHQGCGNWCKIKCCHCMDNGTSNPCPKRWMEVKKKTA